MLDLNDEINTRLATTGKGIELAVRLVDFLMLDTMEKRLNMIITKYANDLIEYPELRDSALALYRKLDNAKKELVKLRKQQKRAELENEL